jgi:hypothetical protein
MCRRRWAEILAKELAMPHPEINMHEIPVGDGEGTGILFVIAVIVPIPIALPEAQIFILASLRIAPPFPPASGGFTLLNAYSD